MPCIYDSNAIIPAPFVTIAKQFVRSEDGRLLRKFFEITLKGKLTATKGSPRADGSFWNQSQSNPPPDESVPAASRLTALQHKQGALERLFDNAGRTLEVQPYDSAAPWKCNPRVKDVVFAEGKWFDVVDYTITLEADNLFFGAIDGGGGIVGVEPEESWAVEVENANTGTYRVSHTVSSQQKATFDDNGNVTAAGWENARSVVEPYLGTAIPENALPPLARTGYAGRNYARSQQTDYGGGRYSVTETFVFLPEQTYVEEYTVDTRYQEGLTRVTVAGTVTGYAAIDHDQNVADRQAERFARAEAGFALIGPNLLTRAQNSSGVSLNPVVLSSNLGKNPVTGVITYSQEYDTRAASLVAGALSESLSISTQDPSDVFASIVVLGRPAGPILQDVGSKTAKVKSVSLEVVMPPWSFGDTLPAAPDVTAVLATFFPGGFVSKSDSNFVPRTGRYTRSISWTYE